MHEMMSLEDRIAMLSTKAIAIHKEERRISLESVRLVKDLEYYRAWQILGMSIEAFAVHIGLTPSKFFKRLAAGRIMERFSELREMFERKETQISHIAMIAGRITEANSRVLIEGIRGKTKREIEAFLPSVGCDGGVSEREQIIDMSIRMTRSQRDTFDRVREFMGRGGTLPSPTETLMKISENFLERFEEKSKNNQDALLVKRSPHEEPDEFNDRQVIEDPKYSWGIEPSSTPNDFETYDLTLPQTIPLRSFDLTKCPLDLSAGSLARREASGGNLVRSERSQNLSLVR